MQDDEPSGDRHWISQSKPLQVTAESVIICPIAITIVIAIVIIILYASTHN